MPAFLALAVLCRYLYPLGYFVQQHDHFPTEDQFVGISNRLMYRKVHLPSKLPVTYLAAYPGGWRYARDNVPDTPTSTETKQTLDRTIDQQIPNKNSHTTYSD